MITCTCPHTRKQFDAEIVIDYGYMDGDRFVAVKCAWCDAAMRIRGEPGYDKANPQVHTLKCSQTLGVASVRQRR